MNCTLRKSIPYPSLPSPPITLPIHCYFHILLSLMTRQIFTPWRISTLHYTSSHHTSSYLTSSHYTTLHYYRLSRERRHYSVCSNKWQCTLQTSTTHPEEWRQKVPMSSILLHFYLLFLSFSSHVISSHISIRTSFAYVCGASCTRL